MPTQATQFAPSLSVSDTHNAHIFIVDDEPANVLLLERMLEDDKFRRVSSATDPREALAACLAEPPGLLMLDLMMPHLSGYELMQALRDAWGPELANSRRPNHRDLI